MLCDPTLLSAYVDSEVSAEQSRGMQAHLSACPECAAELVRMMALKRNLRTARDRYTPTAEFRRAISRQLASPPRRRWLRFAAPAFASGLAAALLIFAVAWNAHTRESARAAAFLGEVADLHITTLASPNPVDVVSTDKHTVKPWFQGRIPFSFNLPDFGSTEFSLLGGKTIYLDQDPGAQLVVAMRQHKISVLIFQDRPQMDGLLSNNNGFSERNGFPIETWRQHGLRFVIIGNADVAELRKLGQAFKNAN